VKADERWQRLHKNAVPPLMDFIAKKIITENFNIKNVTYARNTRTGDEEFNF
jgi:hypothetical protein